MELNVELCQEILKQTEKFHVNSNIKTLNINDVNKLGYTAIDLAIEVK
jgi:hypothetical protein